MHKKNKIRGFISIIIILLGLSSILSCGGAENTVKKGRIKLDESITVAQAFENYTFFKKVKWESFKDEQGRKIVEVTGEFDMDKMFIVDINGQTFNMLEGKEFEEGVLSALLDQAGLYQAQGLNIISQGNLQPVLDIFTDTQTAIIRVNAISNLIRNYHQDPEVTIEYLTSRYEYYLDLNDMHQIKQVAENYIETKYGSLQAFFSNKYEEKMYEPYSDQNESAVNWVQDAIDNYNRLKKEGGKRFHYYLVDLTESYYRDEAFPDRLENFIRNYRNNTQIIDEFVPILKMFAEGDIEEGLVAFDDITGYMKTDFSGNEGTYTCQFAVEGKNFQFYSGTWSITLAFEGIDEPVTFDLPESKDNIPYLLAVYGNYSFIE